MSGQGYERHVAKGCGFDAYQEGVLQTIGGSVNIYGECVYRHVKPAVKNVSPYEETYFSAQQREGTFFVFSNKEENALCETDSFELLEAFWRCLIKALEG
jgi:hypothetical protein